MNLRDLELRVRALMRWPRVERELDDELSFHIECETRKLRDSGLSSEDARAQARARFGPVPLAADRCRDQRGIGVVEDTIRDVRYALRSVSRVPLTTGTIVGTLAVGLGLVTVVFTIFSALFFRTDHVRRPHELFKVQQVPTPGARVWLFWTRPQFEMLRREVPVFVDVSAVLRGITTRIDGPVMNGTLVTGNFFHMLGVNAAVGRTLTPADDQPGASPTVVLSQRGWNKLFAEDAAAIERPVLIKINGRPFEVVGVMPEEFRGLALGAPDFWAPLALAGAVRERYAGKEHELFIDVIGRLKPDISPAAATAALSNWGSGRDGIKPADGRGGYFRLQPSDGTVGEDAREPLVVFLPLFMAFGLVLLVGCANVASLLLARGLSRQREFGIRLSLGASRGRVVRQLLTESLLLALAASTGAFVVSRVGLETAIRVAVATMPPEIAESINLAVPPADWRVVLFLLAGAVVSTLAFGLWPALQATRIDLVRAMRNEVSRHMGPGLARQALVAAQVCASALLLISAAVFLRSALALSGNGSGARTTDTLSVDVANEPRRAAVLQALAEHPAVSALAASSPQAVSMPRSTFASTSEGSPAVGVGYRFVSADYFRLLDIPVLKGRGFTPDEQTPDAGAAVVSESAARRLFPEREAVGQRLRLMRMEDGPLPPASPGPSIPSSILTIVGVVADVKSPMRVLSGTIGAVVYLPTSVAAAGTKITVRVKGDPYQARQALTDRLAAVDPALGAIMTMRTIAGLEAYILQLLFWVTVVLGALALGFTVSGLYSVLSYMVEQRKQEIGIRMALGAHARDVRAAVLLQSLGAATLGILVGAALAGTAAALLLRIPAASHIASILRVTDPVAYIVSLACILSACVLASLIPAARATRIDPIATLRQDG